MHQVYEFDEGDVQAPVPPGPIGVGPEPGYMYQPVLAVVELPADPARPPTPPPPPPPPPPVQEIVEEPVNEEIRIENAAWSREVNRLIDEVAQRPHVEEVNERRVRSDKQL